MDVRVANPGNFMKLSSLLCAGALALIVPAASAQTVVLGNFENQTDGWEVETSNQISFAYSATGASLGSFAAQGRVLVGYNSAFKTFDAATAPQALFANGGTLSYSVFVPASDVTVGGGFLESFVAYTGQTTPYGNQVNAITPGVLTTITAVVPAIAQGQTFFGLFLGLNAGNGTTYAAGGANVYYDNVTFTPVPEPASMAVLGLGLAAFKRRRKNG